MKLNLPTPVAIYTRKSSVSDDKQSKSHSRQENEIKRFCEVNKFAIFQTYSDTQSAFKKPAGDRPGFQKLINWLDKDAGNIVVMTEVSRMARRLDVWQLIESRLRQFRFIELGNVEPTPLIVSVFLSFANEESKKIGERVKSAYRLKVQTYGEGNFKWGNPNIADQGDKGRLVQTGKMKDWWLPILVMDAYLYKVFGLNQTARCEELNKMGHKTRPNKKNKMTGKPITPQNLCRAHRQIGTGGVKEFAEGIDL